MDELGFGVIVFPKADGCPARLEILKVAAGGYLPVGPLSRQPGFYVIGPGRGEAEVGGTKLNHPVGNLQQSEHLFGVGQKLFQFPIGIGGMRELYQLNLVELVLADQPAGIFV
jgi:hypothetical protein